MIHAEIYYATTLLSIDRIAKLCNKGYVHVREHLFKMFPKDFNDARKKACYAKSKYGVKNPRHGKQPTNFVGLCEDGRGYHTVCKPKWYTGRKQYARVFYHHVIMCEALGLTSIPKGFLVHHLDGNGKNNSIHNLALMTLSAHGKLHHPKGKKFGR